jgi:hypothetical protein
MRNPPLHLLRSGIETQASENKTEAHSFKTREATKNKTDSGKRVEDKWPDILFSSQPAFRLSLFRFCCRSLSMPLRANNHHSIVARLVLFLKKRYVQMRNYLGSISNSDEGGPEGMDSTPGNMR